MGKSDVAPPPYIFWYASPQNQPSKLISFGKHLPLFFWSKRNYKKEGLFSCSIFSLQLFFLLCFPFLSGLIVVDNVESQDFNVRKYIWILLCPRMKNIATNVNVLNIFKNASSLSKSNSGNRRSSAGHLGLGSWARAWLFTPCSKTTSSLLK